MKILHVNSLLIGGAARAMLRLHSGLRHAREESQYVTWDGIAGNGNDKAVSAINKYGKHIFPRFDQLPLHFYRRRERDEFNLQWVPGRVPGIVDTLKPDIVHLHWICRGFVRVEDLARIKRPIIWTLHDSWAFTGGCHIPYHCRRYQHGCGNCPQLASSHQHDLSHWLWKRKSKAWKQVGITFVSPSRWLASCVSVSPLLQDKPLKVIPNGLDTESFKPTDRSITRGILGLPHRKRLILFGSISPLTDRNKGFHFFQPALKEVLKLIHSDSLELVMVGADAPRTPLDLGIPIRYMGRLHDDLALRLLYSAVDVTVLPSIQENLPQMAVESIACGTPVVAFNATGFPDIVDHGKNGYLASPYDANDLGSGIVHILEHPDPTSLQQYARNKALKEFSLTTMTERYAAVYRELLS